MYNLRTQSYYYFSSLLKLKIDSIAKLDGYCLPHCSSSIGDSDLRSVRRRGIVCAFLDDRGRAQLELFFEVAEVDVAHQLVVVHQVPVRIAK